MNKINSIVLGAVLLCTASPAIRADAAADARKQVEAEYESMRVALTKEDAVGATAYLTSNFTLTDRDQALSLGAYQEQLGNLFHLADKIKVTGIIKKFLLNKATAYVTHKDHAEMTVRDAKTNKPGKMVIDSLSEDRWIKIGKTWRMEASRVKSQSQTVNGKKLIIKNAQ